MSAHHKYHRCSLPNILLMLDASTRVPLSPSVTCDFAEAHYLARAFLWTKDEGRSLVWDIKAAGQNETNLSTAAQILAKFQCLQDKANRLLSSYKTSESSSSFFRVYDDTAVRRCSRRHGYSWNMGGLSGCSVFDACMYFHYKKTLFPDESSGKLGSSLNTTWLSFLFPRTRQRQHQLKPRRSRRACRHRHQLQPRRPRRACQHRHQPQPRRS